MPGKTQIERRRNKRLRARRKIEFRVTMRKSGSAGNLSGTVFNKSMGGLGIQVMDDKDQLRRKQILRLFVPFSNTKTSAPTLGEVRWIKRRGGGQGECRIGVGYIL